jgi:hydrogenase nickel incorporation protein HypA/HybF
MHEASLIRGLISRVESLAREQNATRVKRVRVWLGAFSHFSVEHFREHFEHASRGTLAEDALLDVELSTDIADPRAQDVVLESLDMEIAG